MGADKANDKEPSADTSSEIIKINSEKKKWEDETLSPHIKQHPEMREEFITTSTRGAFTRPRQNYITKCKIFCTLCQVFFSRGIVEHPEETGRGGAA